MNITFHNIRNRLDFYLRKRFRLSRRVSVDAPIPKRDAQLQLEFKTFIELFDWKSLTAGYAGRRINVADIGARNFAFGPVIDNLFLKHKLEANIHGIEIDAYRMLWGLHTRKDYGEYYAMQMRRGYFHPMDFLQWAVALDMAFLLNPFVSEEPLLAWGLPLSELKPQMIFEHTFRCLAPHHGILILSAPSPEEFEIAKILAAKVGFIPGQTVLWNPPAQSVQQKPRYGMVYRTP